MKNLIFINGTMGVGKSSTSKELNKILPYSVWLDGDWCWMADPFIVNYETKTMVINNICHMLNSFIACSQYENIIFSWVMDYENIYESIVTGINCENCNIYRFTISCSEAELKRRIRGDILQEGRNYEKSLERVKRFDNMNTVKIYNDNLSPYETAKQIKNIVYK